MVEMAYVASLKVIIFIGLIIGVYYTAKFSADLIKENVVDMKMRSASVKVYDSMKNVYYLGNNSRQFVLLPSTIFSLNYVMDVDCGDTTNITMTHKFGTSSESYPIPCNGSYSYSSVGFNNLQVINNNNQVTFALTPR